MNSISMASKDVVRQNAGSHAGFIAFVVISSLVFYRTLSALVEYSLHDDSSSHIILIPLVAFFLLYIERQRVFALARTCIGPGIGLALSGIILYWLASRGPVPQEG